MPFPLAHPAAVLPLRRFCSQRLSFSALIIGSFVPDLAYFIEDYTDFSRTLDLVSGRRLHGFSWVEDKWTWSIFSHSFAGSFLFCLPIGLLITAILYSLRVELVTSLPSPHRGALQPLCARTPKSLMARTASLLLAAWIHSVWDLFTHADASGSLTWAFLGRQVDVFGKSTTLQTWLWLVCSFGGVSALAVAYLNFMKRSGNVWKLDLRADAHRYILWVALLLVAGATATKILSSTGYGWGETGKLSFLHAFSEQFLVILSICVLGLGVFRRLKGVSPHA